jgi:phospholipase/carboxylesterase
MNDADDRGFRARLDCHYLLRVPEAVNERTPLVVTLHGFGANPESMLELTGRLFGTPPVIASLQGPYQFFLDRAAQEVGYGWITSRRPAESIRLHHSMVSHVLDVAGQELDIGPRRRLLAGFSQSVALNYRFAATFPEAVRGVLAICGGLPGDWETGAYLPIRAAVLHIARRADGYYSPEITERYEERLRRRADDVEFHMLEGGHQMPSGARPIVDAWVKRVVG